MRKARYSTATEIGIGMRLRMSKETLEFIKKHDEKLYERIMESA